MMKKILGLALLLSLGACADVQPWQKGMLARQAMQLEQDGMRSRLQQHVYVSKEAAAGGGAVGGGGCGCN
ncbi:DUF4266 domain-containing protein [Massilia sp. W12]|uniref:DUF4266 domain-containing protein n=1 Tax=Massilia sp. W12 TaxID=3126507 RepID=UPI0030D1D584